MQTGFWILVGLIVYIYIGYPMTLSIISRFPRSVQRDEHFCPSVSLIIAAYNEEDVLREKLENSLKIDYPKDRFEIVVVSDGSTDATTAIAKSFQDKGVVLFELSPRGGKTRALNLVVNKVDSEILVFSDANTFYEPDAIRQLVANFADSTVGAVSGDVRLIHAAESHAFSENVYYIYERWLQSLESRVGSIIGADGGMYAVEKRRFHAPSDDAILDDFVISMNIARAGYRVVYEPSAVAWEKGTKTSREEFNRKVRVVAGGIQSLKLGEGVPKLTQPLLLFCYLFHKLMRWAVPLLLLLLFLFTFVLVTEPFYLAVLCGQILF